jgi:biopolymer transport protein ExbD
MKLYRQKILAPTLELTPLVDVVFLLLIFYMVTSTFLKDEGIQLDLPQASSAEIERKESLTFSLIDEHHVEVRGEQIALDDVGAYVKQSWVDDQGIMVKSSREVPVQALVKLLDEIRQTGKTSVTIATTSKD